MQVYRGSRTAGSKIRGAVITLGNFDGVHLGHRALVEQVLIESRKSSRPAVAMTFDPHPVSVVAPEKAPPLITTLEERIELLETLGLDALVVEPFDNEFSRLSPEEFARDVLFERLEPSVLVVGFNYGFGKARSGGVGVLQKAGEDLGFRVIVVPAVKVGETRVSSTGVRNSIRSADFREAARLLGRPFSLTGLVIAGDRRGTEMGFPTANLSVKNRLLPPPGVYACVGEVGSRTGDRLNWSGIRLPAAVHIGPSPTFGVPFTLEAHLVGFEGGDLYGSMVRIEFHRRVRGIVQFSGPGELKERIKEDVREVLKIVGNLA